MGSTSNNKLDIEIDIKEFFHRLWAYKLIIAFFCIIGLTFGAYLATKADIKFSSSVMFKVSEKTNGNILGDRLGAIASMTGVNAPKTSLLGEEDIKGRIFVEGLNDRVDFESR